jgi:hypothetical protein
MDHGHMGHGDMDHGGDMGPMCSMNVSYTPPPSSYHPSNNKPAKQMLFTWDTTNLCIVFPSWRVTGTFSLIWSLIAVVALTAGYEAIREVSRRYEERVAENAKNAPRKSHPAVVFVIMVLLEVLVLERVTPYLPVVSKPMSNVTHYSRQGTLWYRKRRRARLSRRRCTVFRCFTRSSLCKSHQ